MATRLLSKRSDADDVVQDTFVMAFQRIGSLRDPAALRGWLGQIAVSFVRRRLRRARLLRALGFDRGGDTVRMEARPLLEATARRRNRIDQKCQPGLARRVYLGA